MEHKGATERVIELSSGRRISIPVDDGGFRTREIRRPLLQKTTIPVDDGFRTREIRRPLLRERTMELGEGELEELAAAARTRPSTPPPPPPQPGAFWSLEGIVEEDEAIEVSFEPQEPEPGRRGLLWRLMFRLGWVKAEQEYLPLGH